jgi:glutaconate CoA-transferase, subunit A
VKSLTCPWSGVPLAAVPAINPDVTILHAQQIDAQGNVLIRGITGAAREAALAARRLLVTVEEQVATLGGAMNAVVLPSWTVTAASIVPGGAWPSYAHGCYPRDNAFYSAWDAIARDRATFSTWMQRYVLGLRDHAALLHALGIAA